LSAGRGRVVGGTREGRGDERVGHKNSKETTRTDAAEEQESRQRCRHGGSVVVFVVFVAV